MDGCSLQRTCIGGWQSELRASANPLAMLQKVVVRSAAGRTLHADQLLPQRLCRPPTTFVWLHGLASVRRSQKSDALLGLVQKWGAGYLRVDMTGHGKSDGSLDDVTVSSWMEDVQCTLQHVAASSPLDAVSPPPRVCDPSRTL